MWTEAGTGGGGGGGGDAFYSSLPQPYITQVNGWMACLLEPDIDRGAMGPPNPSHPPKLQQTPTLTQVGEHILSLIQQLEDFAASDALTEVGPVAPPGVIER
jgi:hypothetical protein